MRKRLRRHDRQESSPTLNSWVLVVFALGYGLLLWIVAIFTIANYEFARFRQFWSTPGSMGLSNFELAALVGIVFTLVALLSAATAWRSSATRPWGLLATHGASLSIVTAWGVNFYGMAAIPLDDDWYFEAILDEAFDVHRVYLGEVVSIQPCRECPAGAAVLSVSLETTETVEVVASSRENPVGSIVAVHELEGRFTGEARHEFYLPVPTDDAKLFKRFWFRAHAR